MMTNLYKSMEYADYLTTEHWRKVRNKRVAMSNGQCEECGRTTDIEVHHLTYERIGEEEMSDLKVLCAICHREAHGLDVTFQNIERVRFVFGHETVVLHKKLMADRQGLVTS